MTAPDKITAMARQVVERELRKIPTAARHIPVGHSNNVVKVDVEGGRAFVVRMSKLGTARFDMEHAAMRTVAAVGVPVPTVRFIGHAMDAEQAEAVMIADWVNAPSLASIGPANVAVRSEIADRLATVLAAIHSCPVDGFGNLDADLCGRADDFMDWFVTAAAAKVERSIEVISRYATEGAGLPARAMEVLSQHAPLLADSSEHLAHGDFSPSNVLLDETNVAAVIDWESAKGGPPALDFGWLAYIDTDPIVDRDRLMRSYATATGHDADALAAASRLVELRILATMAEWQARAGLTADIPTTLHRLGGTLRLF